MSALVARGVDVVHALDTVFVSAPDVVVLEWASRQDRVIVTRNYRDFSNLAG